ncbi:hypothetical protein [Vibrio sp. 11-4(1)]|uniref:hypothetical protein n=1 Tax=Vibrio sp. 11-4(1) TaxID=2591018 RepID=UPI0014825A23|nr:hypothetical protein [Vibrio sp. 11-4(1)]NNN79084.1 hypothetical protein [Vibrio sp. 11-4(1)]
MAKKLCARRFSTMACIIKKTTTHDGIKPLTTCCNRVLLNLSERKRKKLHISIESVVGTGKWVCIDCIRELGLLDYSPYEVKRKANTSLVRLSFPNEFRAYSYDKLTKDLKGELNFGDSERTLLAKSGEQAVRRAEIEAYLEDKARVKADNRIKEAAKRVYQEKLAALSKPIRVNIKRIRDLAKRDEAKKNRGEALAQIWKLSHLHKTEKYLWHYSIGELENAIANQELYLSGCLMYLKSSHDSCLEETVAQKVAVDYIIYKASYEDLKTKYNLSQNTIRKHIVLGFLHYLDAVYVKPEDIRHWPLFTSKLIHSYLRSLINSTSLEFKGDPVKVVQPSKDRLAVEWSKKMKAIRQRNLSS